ncbi:LINE-1 reverse transcriptase homolog [Linum perenne]
MEFLQFNWETVKRDILQAFDDFVLCEDLPRAINSTFICLIPKKESVEDIRQLRPISLVNSLYKILSKVLAARLRKVVSSCISVHQCAFIEGRQILDASLIANELIDTRRRSGRPGLIIKLDIEKAYDHTNWGCLLEMMRRMNFPNQWIRWMESCISSATFSVLVNGEAKGYFHSSRGLRQGDSLSPFLFIIVMEVLSQFFIKARRANLIEGFFMNEEERSGEVHHILYADDAMVFCGNSREQVQQILAILICFEAVSGLKVNVHKLVMYTIGEVDDGESLAGILGCSLGSFPTTYLGLPLGCRSTSRKTWEPVVNNARSHLETWKAKLLSFGGRVTLLKSVLSQRPIYQLSLLRAPASVIKELEKIQNRFLWEGAGDIRRPHLVRWEIVKTQISRGGLGVLDLKLLNVALLSKWVWRFATERSAWWRRHILCKCGEGLSDWQPNWELQAAGWSVWREIVQLSPRFWEHAWVDRGGGGVSFWFDNWVSGGSLSVRFPRVLAAASFRFPCVYDHVSFLDRYEWNVPLTLNLRGGAEVERQRLLQLLESIPLGWITEGPPIPQWPLKTSESFSVQSFYQLLCSQEYPGWCDFPESTIWKRGVPTKIAGLVWQVFHRRVSTMDNLHKRGLIGPNFCVMCRADLESVSHLFLSCTFASRVWTIFSFKLAIWGPFPSEVQVFIHSWQAGNLSRRLRPFEEVAIHAIFWFLWLERNDRIFRDIKRSPRQVLWKAILAMGRWLRAAGSILVDELHTWLSSWSIEHDPG